MHTHNQDIYTYLAPVYDEVMKDIDYEDWADFIDTLIVKHHKDAATILELACGTGSLALSLDELDCYDITASDISESMLEIARFKSEFAKSLVIWERVDFNTITLDKTYDVILLLFDSINYLTTEAALNNIFQQVRKVISNTGIFIFDFVTPKNSLNHASKMNDEGITPDNWRFIRTSHYLHAENLHYNEFDIYKLSDDKTEIINRFREVHVQKVYTLDQMIHTLSHTDFRVIAAYNDLDLVEASQNSNRITMVTQLK